MKKLFSLLFVLGLTLSACGTSQTQSALPAQTSTSSLISTKTQTPIPPTSTVTHLPTIPTFDVSTIVTVTPAGKAKCPKEDSDFLPLFPIRTKEIFFIENSTNILEYLNEGRTLEKAARRLELAIPFYGDIPIVKDVTGDTTLELVFVDYTEEPKLHIFSCKNGQYQDISPKI